jgi:hypothetical protein
MVICWRGDSNPGTPLLATTNNRKSFIKAFALSCSPSNTLGRFPICFKSAATGTGTRCWGSIIGPPPSGPGGPPLASPGFPPGGPPPLGLALCKAAAKATLSHSPASMGAPGVEVVAGTVGVVVVGGPVQVVVSPGVTVIAGAVVVVDISPLDVIV